MTRIANDVNEAVVSFRRMGTDSAEVSVRPDKSTEISLHLSLNNGQVDVAARLEHGNFDSLNSRWSDLQQSLAQQGIRVGQLDHASLNQNAGNNQQNNQTTSSQTAMEGSADRHEQRSSGRTTDDAEELPVVTKAAASRSAGGKSGPVTVNRGWEMWA
ncbi:MAG TPA: hypothetical protein VMP11_14830 [Verrucomicrobiae bacterium]|nr:hypothetical protein [Verrucomicrobiae bacterium]